MAETSKDTKSNIESMEVEYPFDNIEAWLNAFRNRDENTTKEFFDFPLPVRFHLYWLLKWERRKVILTQWRGSIVTIIFLFYRRYLSFIGTALACLILLACAERRPSPSIGQYVYVDYFGTIHIDRECASELFKNPKTQNERLANAEGVVFVDTCDLDKHFHKYKNYTCRFCPKCVDDEAYKQLRRIMKQHEKKPKAY